MIPHPTLRGGGFKGTPSWPGIQLDRKTITTSATTFLFTGVNFGLPDEFRHILIAYASRGTGTINDIVTASCLVAGLVPTIISGNSFQIGGAGVIVAKPTAPTGDVSLTFAKAQTGGCTIEVYAVRGFSSGPTIAPSNSTSSGTGGTASLSPAAITVADGALAVGASFFNNSTQVATWTGLDKITDGVAGVGTFRLSFAAKIITPGGSKSFSVSLATGQEKSVAVSSIS